MPTQPPTPAPPPRHRNERLFIWLFGAALLLLVGYRLAVYAPPPAAPPTPPAPAAVPPPAPRAAEPSTARFTPPTPKKDDDQREQEDQYVATQTVQGNEMAAVDLSGLDEGRGEPVAEAAVEDKVYTYVEQMPQPPGGLEGLMRYLHVHVKYPAQALREQVEGKVFVNFVVRPDGRLTDVKVIKGLGAGCDEEAVRVLRQMPAWAPGKQNGRVVSVSYTVPVTFAVK